MKLDKAKASGKKGFHRSAAKLELETRNIIDDGFPDHVGLASPPLALAPMIPTVILGARRSAWWSASARTRADQAMMDRDQAAAGLKVSARPFMQ